MIYHAKFSNMCYEFSSILGFFLSIYLFTTNQDRSLYRTILLFLWILLNGVSILRILLTNKSKEDYFKKTLLKWDLIFKKKIYVILFNIILCIVTLILKSSIPFLINGEL